MRLERRPTARSHSNITSEKNNVICEDSHFPNHDVKEKSSLDA
jgi:hypothetical protein